MNLFSEFAPRQVSAAVAEPAVAFDQADRTAHAIGRCPITCDVRCVATSYSNFAADA